MINSELINLFGIGLLDCLMFVRALILAVKSGGGMLQQPK